MFQNARENFVSTWKAQTVQKALSAQGLDGSVAKVATSPSRSRRRATFHGQRTKTGTKIGFFERQSHNLVDTPDCLLMEPAISDARPVFADLTRLGASRSSTISLSVTLSEGGLDISVTNAKEADRDLLSALADLAGRHDLARLTWNGETIAQARQPFQSFGPCRVVPPPGAFLQATRQAEQALVSLVTGATANSSQTLDLFSGCGTFSLPLTVSSSVHAVEAAQELLRAAQDGWARKGGLHRFTTEARDLFRRPLMPDELSRYDAVVIDPPRAGAEEQMQELCKSTVPKIASISCNPVTFARDAAILVRSGYSMSPITVIDQFRWSNHIELFAEFSR